MATIEEYILPDGFKSLIIDLSEDLYNTFPEYIDIFDSAECNVSHFSKNKDKCCPKRMYAEYQHCCNNYRNYFFDILYENYDIFSGDTPIYFLSGVNFNTLWKTDDLTEQTRKTLWKYIQLILFKVVENTDETSDFGNSETFFEAINDEVLKSKMTETLQDIKTVFETMDNSNDSNEENSDNDVNEDSDNKSNSKNKHTDSMPNVDELYNHLTGLFKGKIGCLAEEIMEETREEWESNFGINLENEDKKNDFKSLNDVFSKLLKDPLKLINLIKKIGSKVEQKIKSGELKESELLQETADMMKNLKNTPGMKDMEKIFKTFASTGGGANNKDNVSQGMANMMSMMSGKDSNKKMKMFQREMDKNIKMSKQRERLLKKLEERKKHNEVN